MSKVGLNLPRLKRSDPGGLYRYSYTLGFGREPREIYGRSWSVLANVAPIAPGLATTSEKLVWAVVLVYCYAQQPPAAERLREVARELVPGFLGPWTEELVEELERAIPGELREVLGVEVLRG